MPCPNHPRLSQGLTLIDALSCITLLALLGSLALPNWSTWGARWHLMQARARFEADWHWARWHAQQAAMALRLLPITPCPRSTGNDSLHCGWQWVGWPQGQVLRESALAVGLSVTYKPSNGWQFDAWGEPMGGGASVLFQSAQRPGVDAETLCLNVLGRLRRVRGEGCAE
jgi:Tfp pilus assembly protein FimT